MSLGLKLASILGGGASSWDIGSATYLGTLYPTFSESTDSAPEGVTFSTDGTVMYLHGKTLDTVRQYSLSDAWNIGSAAYASKSLSVAAQDTAVTDVSFSSDGLTMFALGSTGDVVYQYTLTTAWDVSTGSYASKSFAVTGQTTTANGMSFSSDGTTLYVAGYTEKKVFQYTLTTAWDVSTASYSSKSYYFYVVGGFNTNVLGMTFSQDGTKMYLFRAPSAIGYIHTYNLSTAWDVSTATDAAKVYSINFGYTLTGIAFSSDGYNLYVRTTAAKLLRYALTTSWDVTTAYTQTAGNSWFYVGAYATTNPYSISMSDAGTELYAVQQSSSKYVYQFGLSTPWDISTASYNNKFFDVSTQVSVPTCALVIGTNMYVGDSQYVYYYTLSTAWDVTTATYVGSFITFPQTMAVRDIRFSSDGLTMFVNETTSFRVYQYSLSTAFNPTTATYTGKSVLINTQDTSPQHTFFSPDGQKMFVSGSTADVVMQYSLTTAWDISAITYVKSFSVSNIGTGAQLGLWFSSDGKKFYTMTGTSYCVYQFDII